MYGINIMWLEVEIVYMIVINVQLIIAIYEKLFI